ncbi:hypothetical protein P8797_17335 [Bacillus subtilis]|nr:hypothetical protein [Bacillus subtilis]MEC0363948.1 hypothetical protein [Bacillus subtilis]WGD72715.1 hypothetical protein P5668_00265 [Bacillus subtilis]WGD72724.1 hypothetical protein P5668_00215 [Bacillus subtilis]WGD87064.1 hypothetical protein P5656_00060 [Bacillus subtilis]
MQTLEKAFPQLKIDRQKVWASADKLKSNKHGVILLDRSNSDHRDWYNEQDSSKSI